MVKNQNYSGRAMTFPAGVLMGAAISLLWSILAAALVGLLIDREMLAHTAIGYGGMLILLTASILGSLLAWKKIKHRRALVCLTTGGAYYLMLLGLTALFFGGQYEAVGVTGILIFAGSATVILAGLRKGSSHSKRPYKKLH